MVTSKKPANTFYSYTAKRSLRQEEVAAYRRIVLATVIVIGLIVGGYFLGVPLMANLGNNNADPHANTPLGKADNIAPAAPTIASLPDEVRTRSIKITGTAESGTTVIIYLNDEEDVSTLTDKQGLFESNVNLNGGNNTIYAIAKDAANNASRKSKTFEVVYDATPPNVSLLQDLPDQSSSKNLDIKGKTEPKAKVTINDRLAAVNSEGLFKLTLTLTNGENKITIIAEDSAGNIRKIERTVNFGDNTQQATPSANPQ